MRIVHLRRPFRWNGYRFLHMISLCLKVAGPASQCELFREFFISLLCFPLLSFAFTVNCLPSLTVQRESLFLLHVFERTSFLPSPFDLTSIDYLANVCKRCSRQTNFYGCITSKHTLQVALSRFKTL